MGGNGDFVGFECGKLRPGGLTQPLANERKVAEEAHAEAKEEEEDDEGQGQVILATAGGWFD